ncbi:MAG: hypothetical protein HVN35_07365 [Methanobacteriaceae archaeon]|nr:hypothetical protein [Methanobacteriaceae archaeon]
MHVNVEWVDKTLNGWNARINVTLSVDEISRLDKDSICNIEDYSIDIEGSSLKFDCFLNNDEPWEDEHLEELLKALKLEVEYHVHGLLK